MADTHAVDTPADLRLVEARLQDDPLVSLYGGPGARAGAGS